MDDVLPRPVASHVEKPTAINLKKKKRDEDQGIKSHRRRETLVVAATQQMEGDMLEDAGRKMWWECDGCKMNSI